MRILLLALMIALLPLRGWVGDAMAMEMMAMSLHPAEIAMNSIADDDRAMGNRTDMQGHHEHMPHADCHDGMAMASTAATPQHAHGADCATCSACQICHSVALTPVVLDLSTEPLPASLPQTTVSHFASAERAPGFKPPIF